MWILSLIFFVGVILITLMVLYTITVFYIIRMGWWDMLCLM